MTKRRRNAKLPDGELRLERAKIDSNLDPHLQDAVFALQHGRPLDTSVAGRNGNGEWVVDVIGKLRDVDAPVPGLHVVRKVGDTVTGTVRVVDIESVCRHPNVQSLTCARRLHADLKFSVPEINASQSQLAAALPAGPTVTGQNVIVGIVDYGCDFYHRNFRKADGTTRLLYLWDQNTGATSLSPAGYGYGREFEATAINGALAAAAAGPGHPEDPNQAYLNLAYDPGNSAHGTHVMDIAAGNGNGSGIPGVAIEADLIFVDVAAGDYDEDQSIGNSRRLLEAVEYIFAKAAALGKPAVVNVSLGTNGGPHDGSTPVEQGFDSLLATAGRAIVISAGNAWARRGHASGQVAPTAAHIITWQIGPTDTTDNELEIWYSGAQTLGVALITPSGTRLGPVALGSTYEIFSGSTPVGRIIHRHDDPNNHDNQIDILLSPLLPAGNWHVELTTTAGTPVPFHAWIERDDDGPSQFSAVDDDQTHTLGSIACGLHTIAVGSYSALVPSRDLSSFTAEGPTRDGRPKPEVSAPGQSIRAAKSHSQSTRFSSGTSMAAPHVTGVVALVMQAVGHSLTIAELRSIVTSTARKSPPSSTGWDSRYGHGRVSASASVLKAIPAASHVHSPIVLEPPCGADTPSVVESADKNFASRNGMSVEELLRILSDMAQSQRSRIRIEIEASPQR